MLVYKNGYLVPQVLITLLYCCNSCIFINELKIYETSSRLKDLVTQGLSLRSRRDEYCLCACVPVQRWVKNATKEELDELEDCNNGNEIVIQLYKMQIHAL